jgi:photosystem II stability/assembly factor-like uncharacterized protein
MKRKIALWLALVLSGGLPGCSIFSGRFAAIPGEAEETATPISGIQMLDASNGWAMTPLDTNPPLLLSTTDGGENWKDRTPLAARKGKFIIQDFHFWRVKRSAMYHAVGLRFSFARRRDKPTHFLVNSRSRL